MSQVLQRLDLQMLRGLHEVLQLFHGQLHSDGFSQEDSSM
jgi:hypothetical protein